MNKKNIKINRNKIDEINSLIKSDGTKKIDLDLNHRIVKDYHHLYIEKREEEKVSSLNEVLQLKIPSETYFDKYKITIEFIETQEKIKNKNQYLLYALNNDIIELRYRKEGDRILLDENHSKKLKEVLINQKIPRDVRDKIPIFLYKNNIFWIYDVKKAYILKENKNTSELRQVLITVEEVINER